MTNTTDTKTPAKTDGKIMHYGFAVIGEKLRMAEPAATEATALARARKIAEKAEAGIVPTLSVTSTSRAEARDAAEQAWACGYTVEDAAPEEFAGAEEAEPQARADVAAADTAQASAPKRSTGGYFTVGRHEGETVASTVAVRDAATALAIGFTADDDTVAAVKAKSRDEAINRYDAVADALPASRVISVASRGTSTTSTEAKAAKRVPVTPAEGGDTIDTWEPIEATDGNYWVSKSGILHSQESCRFVKDTTPTLSGEALVEVVLRSRTEEGATLPETADGKVVARHLCSSCSGKRRTVEATAAVA